MASLVDMERRIRRLERDIDRLSSIGTEHRFRGRVVGPEARSGQQIPSLSQITNVSSTSTPGGTGALTEEMGFWLAMVLGEKLGDV